MAELRAWLSWAVVRLGYVIRPYDMTADRRRWFWQPRAVCGYQLGLRVRRPPIRGTQSDEQPPTHPEVPL